MNVIDFVSSASYPGRVIVAGRDQAGTPFVVYCLSGRSEASRQRDFHTTDTELEVFDTNGAGNDPLRHYHAAAADCGRVLLGNGDHVEELHAASVTASTLPDLFESILPEPDPPIWTPRIGVLATFTDGDLSILQAFGATGLEMRGELTVLRHLSSTSEPRPAVAVAVKTYGGSALQVEVDGVPSLVSVPFLWRDLVHEVGANIDPAVRIGVIGAEMRSGSFAEWVRG